MSIVPVLAVALQSLLCFRVEEIARELQLVQRERQFSPKGFLQGLIFCWLQNPDATTAELVNAVKLAGCPISESSLVDRFNEDSADLFFAVLKEFCNKIVAASAELLPILSRFPAVELIDSTSISLPDVFSELWPACKENQSAIKLVVRWELLSGRLQIDILSGRSGENTSKLIQEPSLPQTLRLADLGFFSLDRLQGYSSQGVAFVTRVQPHTIIHIKDGEEEKRYALYEYLAQQKKQPIDQWVEIGSEKKVKVRLVASPCPPRIVKKRIEAARKRAMNNGHELNEARLSICEWTVFVTNVPKEKLSEKEVWVVYRVRWQIERLFKLWKSQGGLNRTRGRKAERVRCEVYAKMIGMIIRHWTMLTAGGWWLGRNMWKSGSVVNMMGMLIMVSLEERDKLEWLLEKIAKLQEATQEIQRRGKPATFETLENPEEDGMEGSEKKKRKGKKN